MLRADSFLLFAVEVSSCGCICFADVTAFILHKVVRNQHCEFVPIMPRKLAVAHVLIAVVASLDSSALEPGSLAKTIARPNIAGSASGDYERLTQAPMVWLNLRKTKLSSPSVLAAGLGNSAAVVEHAFASEREA